MWGPNNVDAGLGMDATDAYHAGSVRQQLIQQINATLPEFGMNVGQLAAVSACPQASARTVILPCAAPEVVTSRSTVSPWPPMLRRDTPQFSVKTRVEVQFCLRGMCLSKTLLPLTPRPMSRNAQPPCSVTKPVHTAGVLGIPDAVSPTFCANLGAIPCLYGGCLRGDHVSYPSASGLPQVISDLRAKLSNSFYPTNILKNDDQGLLARDGNSVILVPSNGYTFERTPTQV